MAASILCGCGGSVTPSMPRGAPQATPLSNTSYKVLHSFRGTDDSPSARLTAVNGILYGTGNPSNKYCPFYGWSNCGTVFKITPSGKETRLYLFDTPYAPDGAHPNGLLDVNGTLYGTALDGGPASCWCGTVFSVTTSGTVQLLHAFSNADDGTNPSGELIDFRGRLYGTTSLGGRDCVGSHQVACGSVFETTTAGRASVLYRFKGGADGSEPSARLAIVGNALYGTTGRGGDSTCFSLGCGTVFKITTSGSERVIHRFKGGGDGAYPVSPLTNVGGILYGTTFGGGINKCPGPGGCGTVFKVTASGEETVLYRFKGGKGGSNPISGLTDVNGNLYGVTASGGSLSCYPSFNGCGTVFKVTQSGRVIILHRFQGGSDGDFPVAGLTLLDGKLYGSTVGGGADNSGTIFVLTP